MTGREAHHSTERIITDAYQDQTDFRRDFCRRNRLRRPGLRHLRRQRVLGQRVRPGDIDTAAIRAEYRLLRTCHIEGDLDYAAGVILALCDALDEARVKVSNLHTVEEKHRDAANEQFHRANRLQAENERLRATLGAIRMTGPDDAGEYWINIEGPGNTACGVNIGRPMNSSVAGRIERWREEARAALADGEA